MRDYDPKGHEDLYACTDLLYDFKRHGELYDRFDLFMNKRSKGHQRSP